ncbi:MAG: type I methionyl aminopeptidase [Chloroflexi bacterium]|nr:type I methionyl aminopeptidase [Chloroflexota bacterium]
MRPKRRRVGIIIKTAEELAAMREAGRIVAVTLAALREAVKPGVTTAQLDVIAEEMAHRQGAVPSFKGYRGYPASLCASLNQEVVHGIPNPRRVLHEGDIISLDYGVIYKGLQGDGAITVPVGKVSDLARRLMDVTQHALGEGIAQVRPNNRLSDIGHAIQAYVEGEGFSVVRQYVGHGIGRSMHEEPNVPNFGVAGRGPLLKPGMVFALEPMVNVGTYETAVLEDGWTVVTEDGSLSAHFEHTVAVTADGPVVLTLP